MSGLILNDTIQESLAIQQDTFSDIFGTPMSKCGVQKIQAVFIFRILWIEFNTFASNTKQQNK